MGFEGEQGVKRLRRDKVRDGEVRSEARSREEKYQGRTRRTKATRGKEKKRNISTIGILSIIPIYSIKSIQSNLAKKNPKTRTH